MAQQRFASLAAKVVVHGVGAADQLFHLTPHVFDPTRVTMSERSDGMSPIEIQVAVARVTEHVISIAFGQPNRKADVFIYAGRCTGLLVFERSSQVSYRLERRQMKPPGSRSPSVSSKPKTQFRFWIACPAAPFPRLSITPNPTEPSDSAPAKPTKA